MITENGIVTNADASIAWIKTQRSSSCKACESRDNCETLKSQKVMHVKVNNTLNVQKNDQVVIGLETKPLLFMTFMLYVFPIILLMVGAAIGNSLALSFKTDQSLTSMATGFLLFSLSIFIIRKFNNKYAKNQKYKPFLVRKLSKLSSNNCYPA